MQFLKTRSIWLFSLITLVAVGCGTEFDTYDDGDESLNESSAELRATAERRGVRALPVERRADSNDADDGPELIPCARPVPARGLVCIRGFWSTGDDCASDRQCDDGSICLALKFPHDPLCFLLQSEDDSIECPAGSVGPDTPILCAPGFEPELVTRDGCTSCVPIAEECGAAERCRAAGFSLRQCIIAHAGSAQRARHIIGRATESDLSPADVLRILACGNSDNGDPTRPEPRPRGVEVEPEPAPEEEPSR